MNTPTCKSSLPSLPGNPTVIKTARLGLSYLLFLSLPYFPRAMGLLFDILRYIPLLGRLVPREKRCVLLKLPDELLVMIFSQLSLPSQACFALTCKFLLERFGYVLKNEKFAFPHIHVNGHYVVSPLPNPRERTELLLRLRYFPLWGRGWNYCGCCLKLHPLDEFKFLALNPTPVVSWCIYPGIVVLCPCIHLNARRKIRLIEELEMGQLENSSNWHSCQWHYSQGPTVDITIALSVTELGDLMVQTRYLVRPGRSNNFKTCAMVCCPHHNIFSYLDRVRPQQVGRDCNWCQTSIQADRDNKQSSLQVTRYLGGKIDPVSQSWSNQCEQNYSKIHR